MKKLRHDVARRDHYEELTNTIIAKLEDGVLPWRRPWDPKKCAAGESPMNPVTGRTYRGVNALALAMSPRAFGGDPRWMSYRQAAARGWQVRKGEKGAIVFFYKKLEIRSDDEDKRTIPLLRAYVVFHASQLDGIPELGEPEAPKPVAERIADADLIVKASGVRVAIGGDRAYYAPSTDHIQMPPDEAFASPPDWAATIVTSSPHASGASHRLNRDLTGRFGDTSYAREELRAELASCFRGNDARAALRRSQPRKLHSVLGRRPEERQARDLSRRGRRQSDRRMDPLPPSGAWPPATTSPTRRTMSSRRRLRPRP